MVLFKDTELPLQLQTQTPRANRSLGVMTWLYAKEKHVYFSFLFFFCYHCTDLYCEEKYPIYVVDVSNICVLYF